jgi:hypothetical protein
MSHHSPSIYPFTDGLDSTRELRAMHKAGIMKGELVLDRRRDLLLNTLLWMLGHQAGHRS